MGNKSNRTLTANSFIPGIAVTVTASGITTLSVASAQLQVFTGTLAQTIKLPVATTLAAGQTIGINNESSSAITIQFQDGTSFSDAAGVSYATVPANKAVVLTVQTVATSNGTWNVFTSAGPSTGYTIINPTIQKFTSGSGTYTTPSGVQYIKVRMVGGGGGGSGSGNGAAGTGGSGGTTSFGTSLLSAPGGGGAAYSAAIVSGGSATVSAPAIGSAFTGATGSAGNYNNGVQAALNGAPGGGSILFGGSGGGGLGNAAAGTNGITNTGGGGGGGGGGNNIAGYTGTGGGGSGSLEAIIASPSVTYTYSIGIAGTSGTAGTSGFAGGAGGSGYIEVTEYYFNNPAQGVTVTASYAPTVQKFISGSGTYTTPSGVQYINVKLVGGGGGGGGGDNVSGGAGGGGGGAGGYCESNISTPSATYSYSVGGAAAGGAAGNPGNTGTVGNNSTFSSFTASGGVAGQGGQTVSQPGTGGAGGAASGANKNIAGGSGTAGVPGLGGVTQGIGGTGGNSSIGGGGVGVGGNGTGGAGATNSGGGGAGGSGLGGAGAAGYIEVTEYYVVLATGAPNGSTALPTVQKFTSSSGTYTTPANVAYIRVKMVGGGGGGANSGTGAGNGTTGGNSTFGSSLLTANGGNGGLIATTSAGVSGGTGGTATVTISGTVLQVVALQGGTGGGTAGTSVGAGAGGGGGSGPYGGAVVGAADAANAPNAVANTGAGGAGAGGGNALAGSSGGGAGGYIDALLISPSATYAYVIGAAGTGSGGGSFAGGAGGSGYIEVTEYYNNAVVQVSTAASIQPTVQKFTSGSGTYTTPSGVQYLKIKMVGAGGSGGGSGTSSGGTAGTSGGNTIFGTSLLTANGGAGGGHSNQDGGIGGTATISAPAIGTALSGGTGLPGDVGAAGTSYTGGAGGSTIFGGAGVPVFSTGAGGNAATNTGAGGSGGFAPTGGNSASGGGSGGYVDGIIPAPVATYAYAVGAGQAGGAAGGAGFAGGNSAAGYIEVTEYYNNLAIGSTTSVAANTIFAGPTSGSNANPGFRALVAADFPGTWTTWVPTISASSGSITTSSAVARYQQFGKTVFISIAITVTTNGTGAGNLQCTLPFTSQSIAAFSAVETVNNGSACSAYISASGTTVRINTYNNTYPVTSGSIILVCGSYETT